MSVVIKSNYNGDVRRYNNSQLLTSFEALNQAIRTAYNESSIILKYEDEEKELITVTTQQEWNEAIENIKAAGEKTIKIHVFTATTAKNNINPVTVEDVTKEELKA